ncbi:MAG: hypothetical protein LLG14_12205 [Nocardiaceae bacterium]|nr:hypothetical protein [Nocardiaceae bacterium]
MTAVAIESLTPAQVVRAFGDANVHVLERGALIDLIETAEAVKSAAAAAQARATMELLQAEKAARPKWRPERIARTVASMVALARRDSPRRGSDHVNLAKSLTEALPATLQLLRGKVVRAPGSHDLKGDEPPLDGRPPGGRPRDRRQAHRCRRS